MSGVIVNMSNEIWMLMNFWSLNGNISIIENTMTIVSIAAAFMGIIGLLVALVSLVENLEKNYFTKN